MYIGFLMIPEARRKTALDTLIADRLRANYDGEVHYTTLRNYSYAKVHNQKTLLAKHWTERILQDTSKTFHFYLVGLNMDRLQLSAFGPGHTRNRAIYNRFFRASVRYALKTFFSPQNVSVTAVFHDEDALQHDDVFDWHTIWRLDRDEKRLSFTADKIEFIQSDHRKELLYPEESHFVQLCDLVMGGLRQCLDAPNHKDGCCEIGQMLMPLAERLTDPKAVYNPNSRYQHKNRLMMRFFPDQSLTQEQLDDPYMRAQSGFYFCRKLHFADRLAGQCCFPGM